MIIYNALGKFFEEQLSNLNCDNYTKAYIVSIFSKYKNCEFDYSKESITIRFSSARINYSFVEFQSIADYLFFANSLFPESLKSASMEYYLTIAKLSYYSCYRLINRQLVIYEQLADEFETLTDQTRQIIQNI